MVFKFPTLATLFALLISTGHTAPVISEIMASNTTSLQDEDGDTPDWIEIHNPDSTAVDLSGWHLSDDNTQPDKWSFPSVVIPAGGYLLVFASDKDRSTPGSELHTNFKLASEGEYLALTQADGTPSTEFTPSFPPLQSDVSYGIPQATQETVSVVSVGANLRYQVPAAPISGWNSNHFNDSSWTSGITGIGYDTGSSYDPYIATDIQSETYNQTNTYSTYLRISFQITDPSKVNHLNFLAKYDDGFAAYINGEFITSANAPATLEWNSKANSSREADLSTYQYWDASALIPHLVAGTNTLAIQMLNQNINSSDFLMIPKLEVTSHVELSENTYHFFIQSTPGSINHTPVGEPAEAVAISEASGVKTDAITVTLTSTEANAEIHYTLDGSEPSQQSPLYSQAIPLSEPTRLRARAYANGKVGSPVSAADYSFLDSSLLDYVSHVPIIVMDNFGAGSYPNKGRSNDGSNVQQLARQPNLISIFETPDNSLPFARPPSLQTRAGCRVRGSSSSGFPRKPLSIEFWDEQNEERKLSPFGMKAEADWVLYAPYSNYDKSLLHNPVSFEVAKKIGALAPNARVVVVFQNKDGGKITASDMNGVYIFMEKIERNRAGADFRQMNPNGTDGGWMIKVDRMDAIPVGMPADTIQPNFHAPGPDGILSIPDDQDSSGGSQSVDDISTYYHSYLNLAHPNGYDILSSQRNTVQSDVRAMDAAVWSANSDDPTTGYAAHLDAISWAKHYAVQNFAKNNDALVLSTYFYKPSPEESIKMGPVWDFDRAYTRNGSATSQPLHSANRDWFDGLFDDVNFRQIHQDVWQQARHSSLTNAELERILDQAAAGLLPEQIVASGLSYTDWQSRVSAMKTWMLTRANYLDSQYEALPSISPSDENFSGNLLVTMTPADGGNVYFTTDGSDPRLSGGGLSPSAQLYTAGLTLFSRTRIIARTKNGSDWSAPVEKNYHRLSDAPQLVVSEICYHPATPSADELSAGFTNADDFEFLEIQNIGSSQAELSTLSFSDGIQFDFSAASIQALAPDSRLLLVRNLAAFEYRHGTGLPVAGVYQGALNNAGEQLTLSDPLIQLTLQDFSYDDTAPWPEAADGLGYSLVLKRPARNPDHKLPSNWRCSAHPGGNPANSDARPAFAGNARDDLDGDGVSALVEHFLGTSDHQTNSGSHPYAVGTIKSPDDGLSYPSFEVTYTIGADDIYPSGLCSQNMKEWSALDSNIILISHTLNGDGTATLVWRSTIPSTTSPQFFRLKVSPF